MMDFKSLFQNGDMRSPKGAVEACEYVLKNQNSIIELIDLIQCGNKKIQMGAADALEKISLKNIQILIRVKSKLFEIAKIAEQKEVRWHFALILPRLNLSKQEAKAAFEIIENYLEDKSKIVIAFSLSALFEFSKIESNINSRFLEILDVFQNNPSPAIKVRVRNIFKEINKQDNLK
jgi:hypothetical protein